MMVDLSDILVYYDVVTFPEQSDPWSQWKSSFFHLAWPGI